MVSPPSDFEQGKRPKTPDDRARAAAGSRRYRNANKDEINEHWREKYRTDPEFRERVKERARQISNDAYDVLFARQGGVCAACKQKYHRRLHADHCHATGKLRGLLCSNCNTGLGLYNDDADRLLAAVAYLVASRCDIGSADPTVIAAEMAERLSRRLEVLLREAFALRPEGAGRAGRAADRLQSPNKVIRRDGHAQNNRSGRGAGGRSLPRVNGFDVGRGRRRHQGPERGRDEARVRRAGRPV